ncbi:conserved hypothetical protein [Agrobacterium deltaense NCPPB 1641]|uniref:Uncharacterized protein n=1 Tax=Agrobacterium deltaense NCPPB 1641 TaxID=1183425 RepID=A0A1S7TLR5_9HYPH|nr:conserved hypothetical protein [Agrobacterium deltaense NCPPB 1641]
MRPPFHLGRFFALLNPCPAEKLPLRQTTPSRSGTFSPTQNDFTKRRNAGCTDYFCPVFKMTRIAANKGSNNISVQFMRSSSPVCFHSVHRKIRDV